MKVPNNEYWYHVKKVTTPRQEKLDLLIKLEHDLLYLDPYELQVIINCGQIPKEFRELLRSNAGSKDRVVTFNELKKKYENVSDDDSENTDSDDNDNTDSDDSDTNLNKIDDSEKSDFKQLDIIDKKFTAYVDEENIELPKLNIIQDLYSIDNYTFDDDDENLESLIQYKIRKFWNQVLNDESLIKILRKKTGGKYFNHIKELFFNEYDEVIKYTPAKGYSFKVENKKTKKWHISPPLLMQMLTVYRLIKYKIYGNWSGTGAGKTLSYILASRSIDARITLVVVVNSIVEQACKDIMFAYPDSVVYTKYDKRLKIDTTKHNYIVLNYEKFQQNYSEELYQHLTNNHKIDFVVIDEVHSVKFREDVNKYTTKEKEENKEESLRRQVLMRIIGRAKQNNSDLHLLTLSATAIINEISEAKSLLMLMTGLSYDEISNRSTIENGMAMFRLLLLHGLRCMPKYKTELKELTAHNTQHLNINGDHLIDQLLKTKSKRVLDIEQILLPDKLNAIASDLKKGTVIYTYFTTGIIKQIVKYVESLGYTVGTYTGEDNAKTRKDNFDDFRSGKKDILIGSAPIGTGLDKLQEVCDNMIILTLPWTDSEYKQLIGRLLRKGCVYKFINIIIPQIIIDLGNNEIWSWDIQRLNRIKFKSTLADLVLDGKLPSEKMASIETMRKEAIKAIEKWKERISSGDIISINRSKIEIDLYPEILDEEQKRKQIESELQDFNRKGKTTLSSTMHKIFNDDPDLFFKYHALRHNSMKSWSEIPYEYIASKIKNKSRKVADFGCGENKLKDLIPNDVVSFDHISIDGIAHACDMKDVSKHLKDESIDIAVFSLALWGKNYKDYLVEAYRVLNYDGVIYIAEPSHRYDGCDGQEELKQLIVEAGFNLVGNIENRGKFIYIKGIKN